MPGFKHLIHASMFCFCIKKGQSLTLSSLQTETDTCADGVNPDERLDVS